MVSPICLPKPTVDARINEFAYDCSDSGDPNEVIEVRLENAFSGTLADFTVTLFNGNGNLIYNRETVDNFTVGNNDGTYTYYTWMPTSIMNGGPDGLSLDFQGALIDFLSYEGTMTGTTSPVTGVNSIDVGIEQSNDTPCDETLQLNDVGNWVANMATVGEPNEPVINTEVTAIGTCEGITAMEENTYNVKILGLDITSTYNFDLNGDGIADITNFSGDSSFTTSVIDGNNIQFTDGTNSMKIQIDLGADGNYDEVIQVHEVLCTDANNDGLLDFSAACDANNEGIIVATVSPYILSLIHISEPTRPY